MKTLLLSLLLLPWLGRPAVAQTLCRPGLLGGLSCSGPGGQTLVRPQLNGGYRIHSYPTPAPYYTPYQYQQPRTTTCSPRMNGGYFCY